MNATILSMSSAVNVKIEPFIFQYEMFWSNAYTVDASD